MFWGICVAANDDHAEIGEMRTRGPDFLPINDPVIAVSNAACAKAGQIGSRRRF